MRVSYNTLFGFILISIIWTSCVYHDLEPIKPPFQVTQEQLDAAVMLATDQDTAIAGDPFNVFVTDTFTTLHKLRDLFENLPLDKSVSVGTIMTRRAYYYQHTLDRDSLLNVLVMVKREPGYYPEGGDWEYMDIARDKTTDYDVHPNGILIDAGNTVARGKISRCANCHARADGNDFLFHR